MSNDRQLQSEFEIRATVESRNTLRTQAGLSPVELQHELDRIDQVQRERAFEQLMQSPLGYRVEQKLLHRLRRRRNNPNWKPSGVLSGSGWAFHAMLVKQIQKLSERVKGQPISNLTNQSGGGMKRVFRRLNPLR